MKKNTCLLLLMLGSRLLPAQEVLRVQNGAVLSLVNGATMTIAGGITLANGSALHNAGTITLKQNGTAGDANWVDNSTSAYGYGVGTVVFSSSAAQSVATKNTFGFLEVSTAGLTLASDINSDNWLLTQGPVTTGAFTAITLSTARTAIQASPANTGYSKSWINGNLRRFIAPAAVDSYDFPVGNSARNNLVTLDNLSASPLVSTTYLDASFGPKPGTDAGLILTEGGTPFSSVNNGGVWRLTPNAEPTGGKYDLLLYLGGFTGLMDNEFALLERPDASSNATDWTVSAGSSVPAADQPGRTLAAGYAQRNGISTFSQFGIGMTDFPLPVTLLDFNVQRFNKALVNLDWQTATEENNKGFDIERRLDNEAAFSSIGFVATAAPNGNSNSVLSYSYADDNSYAGISYYRLDQTDLDGKSAYSAVRAASGDGTSGLSVLIYPNPAHGQFTLRVDGNDKPYKAIIVDLLGQVVREVSATGTNNVFIDGLKTGLYYVRIPDIFGKGKSFVEKVLIVP